MNRILGSYRFRVAAGLLVCLVLVVAIVPSIRRLTSTPEAAPRESGEQAPANEGTSATLVRAPLPRDDFVGSDACRECHEEVSDEYESHPMFLTLAPVLEASVLEDYTDDPKFAPPGPRRYRVERTESGVIHHETMLDAAGETVYDQAVEMHYAVGSGARGRSYLAFENGMFFMSPITWYSEAQQWDLSPGYSPVAHPRFSRRVSDGCMTCHSGQLATQREAPNRFLDPPVLEHAIGCERCHGPGGRHVQWHEEDGGADGEADPMVNLAQLPHRRQDDVCNQCHILGKSRVLRFGRSEYDFRPGDSLDDIWTVFLEGAKASTEAGAVTQVEQMHSSVCFKKSEGRLMCTSCHDAHSIPKPEQVAEFYRDKCEECHQPDGRHCSAPIEERRKPPANDSCIHCHMPAFAASNVPHTSQTDHRILRSAESKLTKRRARPGLVFSDAPELVPQIERDRAEGLRLAGLATLRNDEAAGSDARELLIPVVQAAPEDAVALEAIGVTFWVAKEPGFARECFEEALELSPNRESLLKRLAMLCHETQDFRSGADYAERYLKLNPRSPDMYGRYAYMLAQLRQFAQAIETAKRGLEVDPAHRALHKWLAEMYESQGQEDESRHHRTMLERLSQKR